MLSLRKWATPLTIGTFILMSTTGVLMFFHLSSGLNKTAHEWFGFLFLAGGIAHVLGNWPLFKAHLRVPRRLAIIGVCVAVLGLSFISLGAETKGRPNRAVFEQLASVSLETLAPVTGRSTEDLLAALSAVGATDALATSTVRDLSGGNRAQQAQLLTAAFEN